jgi:hypothetical protein
MLAKAFSDIWLKYWINDGAGSAQDSTSSGASDDEVGALRDNPIFDTYAVVYGMSGLGFLLLQVLWRTLLIDWIEINQLHDHAVGSWVCVHQSHTALVICPAPQCVQQGHYTGLFDVHLMRSHLLVPRRWYERQCRSSTQLQLDRSSIASPKLVSLEFDMMRALPVVHCFNRVGS